MPEIQIVDRSRSRRGERVLRASLLVSLGSLLAASVVIVARPGVGPAAPFSFVAPLPDLPLQLPALAGAPDVLAPLVLAPLPGPRRDVRSDRRDRRVTTSLVSEVAVSGGGSSASATAGPTSSAQPVGPWMSSPTSPSPEPATPPGMPAGQPAADGHRLHAILDPVRQAVTDTAAGVAPVLVPVVDAIFVRADRVLDEAEDAAPAPEPVTEPEQA